MANTKKKYAETTIITRSQRCVAVRKPVTVNDKKLLRKKILKILQKPSGTRTNDDETVLRQRTELVQEIQQKIDKKEAVKRRSIEVEDPDDVLVAKSERLANVLRNAKHLVIYTGAGISTAAKIPDYRGPNGIWTLLQQGKEIQKYNISTAEPTFTHMALCKLFKENIVKYVVSQNCDGLHLRSGIPRNALSELHGNMNIEVCKNCKPSRQYWRLFDVTENTARYAHKTMRSCYYCHDSLVDTIVHFGERGTLQWPLNWSGACRNADKADVIVCLGSSLKVMKRYPWLWQMDKPAKKRPELYIVNLQWTPKDNKCALKINGKCDQVMKLVMDCLNLDVPAYDKQLDPIFYHFTEMNDLETHTTNQQSLVLDKKENVVRENVLKPKVTDPDASAAANESQTSLDTNQILMQYFYVNLLYTNFYLINCQIADELTNPLALLPFQLALPANVVEQADGHMPTANAATATTANSEKSPKCAFCANNFDADECQFYEKTDAEFRADGLTRYSKSQRKSLPVVCQCCAFSTDDEDGDGDGDGDCDCDDNVDDESENDVEMQEPVPDDATGSAKKECNSSTAAAATTTTTSAVLPVGWFGKGYRKNRKIRKRSTSTKSKTD